MLHERFQGFADEPGTAQSSFIGKLVENFSEFGFETNRHLPAWRGSLGQRLGGHTVQGGFHQAGDRQISCVVGQRLQALPQWLLDLKAYGA
ncbi:MAG: hypothetical protein E1N59_2308 [Puniceicoccaceae bacterium 5H]|nr:MAG: hypothetical protein E1N59_2308 [Puniceicoccaceae bacterium 5H]